MTLRQRKFSIQKHGRRPHRAKRDNVNLLIAPIDKNGVRKVGIKVTDANSQFVKIFKTFDFNVIDSTFEYFFYFCGELRSVLLGTEYKLIELTDGYDVQDKNIYIDYTHTPPRITVEDREGFPAQLESGRKQLMYKKPEGVWKYTVVKEVSRDDKYLECIVIKDGKEQFRKFKVENIILEIEE